MKGNADGVPSVRKGKSSAAAIFCSEEGLFLGASVLALVGVMEPSTIEAIACREALCLSKDACFNSMTIASDCSGVVKAYRKNPLVKT